MGYKSNGLAKGRQSFATHSLDLIKIKGKWVISLKST